MRKLATFFLCFLVSANFSYAQIKSTKFAEPKITKSSKPYDGSENYLGENVSQYIGHDLFVKPLPKCLREYGYDGFVLDYMEDMSSKTNIYKCCDSLYSKHKELEGKYFTVIDVLKHPQEDYLNKHKYFLKLKSKDSGDIVYFEYDSEIEGIFPFISVTYFERQKKDLIGKQFIKNYRDLDEIRNDIISGDTLKIDIGSKWTCKKITMEEEYFSLVLILKNEKNQTISIHLNDYKNPYRPTLFLSEDAEKYKNKFGQKIWDNILSGKVMLGMSAEACELSWGRPTKINKTISSGSRDEQWVYGGESNYLYFKNRILVSIQTP